MFFPYEHHCSEEKIRANINSNEVFQDRQKQAETLTG
jgi:hypothetical protein